MVYNNMDSSAGFCVVTPLLTFPCGCALLFAPHRIMTRVYFDPINYYFD